MLKLYFEKLLKFIVLGKHETEDVFRHVDISQYPEKLYKFRSCDSEYSFDILEKDYLWADSPENFYDPFDSIVNTNYKKLLENFHTCLLSHMSEIIYSCLTDEEKEKYSLKDFDVVKQCAFDDNEVYSRSKIQKYLREAEKREDLKQLLESMSLDQTVESFSKSIASSFSALINHLRKNVFVCCLSQNGDNFKMWEDYADKYRGFVIEYSFDKRDESIVKKALYNLFPVQYYKRMPKYDTTELNEFFFQKQFYGVLIDISDSIVDNYKHLLYKKFEYASEEEWRIIVKNKELQEIHFPFATAVYAGYKITDENFERLKKICENKAIPLYKQALDKVGGKFVYYQV